MSNPREAVALALRGLADTLRHHRDLGLRDLALAGVPFPDPADALREQERARQGCQICKLCKSRTNVAFGSGNARARLMVVGEGPGEEEDKQGLPFVGRAGQLLTKMLASVGFDRERGYLIGVEVPLVGLTAIRPGRAADGEATEDEAARAARQQARDADISQEPGGAAPTAYALLKILTIVLAAMWAGGLLSGWLGRFITLPAYIGAMLVAAMVRNGAEFSGARIEQRTVDDIGTIALSLFLAMALMSLRLWELFDLALPLLVILAAQVAMMAAFAYFVTFRVMGRDYDAAVMSGGHCGFGLGATPNAVANMEAITERFGSAPRAFLVVPMVGAFFIDFTNAIIITL